ncbi:hypothetical protein XENOCAPTIV_021030 [Xenoophorus captivus]|uniref:Uncharacterized protein n=1 Tax=Xenoophorus captivus TaxID=1517983 RepID=A0ABV0S0Y5_9TELE
MEQLPPVHYEGALSEADAQTTGSSGLCFLQDWVLLPGSQSNQQLPTHYLMAVKLHSRAFWPLDCHTPCLLCRLECLLYICSNVNMVRWPW